MALAKVLKSIDSLDESLQKLYRKDGDEYVLDVEQDDSDKKLAEFRNTNRKLLKEREDMAKKLERFKDLDPEGVDDLLQAKKTLDDLADKDLLKAGKIDELLNKRIETYKQATEAKLAAAAKREKELETRLNSLTNRLATSTIETAALAAARKQGVLRAGAETDVLNRARAAFNIDPETFDLKINDGVLDGDGKPVATIDDWAKSLFKQTSYLFESGSGGGSRGGAGGAPAGAKSFVDINDPTAVGAQLEGIAKGTVVAR